MKCCTQVFTAIALLSIVSCDTFNAPLNTSGSFDPLRTAGGGASGPNLATGPTYRAGQFVRAALDNTAFYKSKPRDGSNADQLLKRGTSMKVVSSGSSYLKVELDSGDIGFVPVVMIEDANSAPQRTSSSREVQVYPPLPSSFDSGPIQPLPPNDPAGAPPEGAIPTVIDPEAPATNTTPPIVTPTTETFPAPAPSVAPAPVESAPLPPNDEEIAAGKVETPPPAPVEKPAGQ
ncbi:MAG: hypothetical protein HC767_02425 [Akkermansiaceae bacterium]|nr:hypothetical protein [Akkermansiaceae bacterium]